MPKTNCNYCSKRLTKEQALRAENEQLRAALFTLNPEKVLEDTTELMNEYEQRLAVLQKDSDRLQAIEDGLTVEYSRPYWSASTRSTMFSGYETLRDAIDSAMGW